MKPFLLPLLLLLSLFPSPSSSGPCREQCGTIEVHYPFGIDDGCGAPQFRHMFTCNATSNSLFFVTPNGNFKVQSIDYKAQTMTVYDPDMSTCNILQPHHDLVLSDLQYAIIPPSPDTIFALLNCSVDSPLLHRFRSLCFDLPGHSCHDLYSSCASFRVFTGAPAAPGGVLGGVSGGGGGFPTTNGSVPGIGVNTGIYPPPIAPRKVSLADDDGGGGGGGYYGPPGGGGGGGGPGYSGSPGGGGYYGGQPGYSGGGGPGYYGGQPGYSGSPGGGGGGGGYYGSSPGGGQPGYYGTPGGGGGGQPGYGSPGGGGQPYYSGPGGGQPYYGGSGGGQPGYSGSPGGGGGQPGYSGTPGGGPSGGGSSGGGGGGGSGDFGTPVSPPVSSSPPPVGDDGGGSGGGQSGNDRSAPHYDDKPPVDSNTGGGGGSGPACCFTGYSTVKVMKLDILDCTHFTSFYNADKLKGVGPMEWSYGVKFSYSVPDMGCDRCKKSGGSCGFDAETEALMCLCSGASNSTRQCGTADLDAGERWTPLTIMGSCILALAVFFLADSCIFLSFFL